MPDTLKVLIVTPTYPPDITGNAITAHRLYNGLRDKGIEVHVVVSAHYGASDFKPDIVHALHALKGGSLARKLAEESHAPLVVTITGTDLNIDLLQDGSEELIAVLSSAGRIITYSPSARDKLVSRLPALSEKVVVVRPSVDITRSTGKNDTLPPGFNFLLPSGIRRVKAPSFAIRPLEELRKEFSSINLTIVGPVRDDEEWGLFSKVIEGKDWISYRAVSTDEMPDLYAEADVVLNTSISEGLSNVILEAMYSGKPLLASDCDGNRSVIADGVEGLLYKQGDEGDFVQKARTLILDRDLREKMGRAGIDKVAREYSLAAEMEGHLRLYGDVLGRTISRIKRK